ncbi:MAG: sulfotransferase [Actinobacteria bacterium]|nr:sulfotransferase [Actinomycetota bacterium]
MSEREPPSPPAGPPVFVVGCGRSGTTMFRLMLDSHPEVAVPGESHFVPGLWRRRRRYVRDGRLDPRALAAALVATPHFGNWGIPAGAVWRRVDALEGAGFPEVVEAAFMAYADRHGKVRWGDKTPIYVLSIPLLARLFPGARFVHLIRDGRDVALSYLSVPWGPESIWDAAAKWRRDVGAGIRDGRPLGAERYLEVGYDDLVADPEGVLARVCAFAGLEYSPRMLEYHRDGEERIQSPPSGVPFHARAARPPTRGARDWRTEMAEADVMAFEAAAGDLLEELGFERRHERLPAGIRAQAAARLAGIRTRGAVATARKRLRQRRGGPGPGERTSGAPLSEDAR